MPEEIRALGHVGTAAKRNYPPCPKCGALRGDPCRTPSWKTRAPHKERWSAIGDEAHAHDAEG